MRTSVRCLLSFAVATVFRVSMAQAQPSVSVSLVPGAQDVALGARVTVQVFVTPQGGANMSGAGGRITYPRAKLQFRVGDSAMNAAVWAFSSTVNETVAGEINLFGMKSGGGITTQALLGTLVFDAVALGSEALTPVSLQSSIFGWDASDNLNQQIPVQGLSGATVDVVDVVVATPTPTRTYTNTPVMVGNTPTRTRTPTPTAARSASPTINYADECL